MKHIKTFTLNEDHSMTSSENQFTKNMTKLVLQSILDDFENLS